MEGLLRPPGPPPPTCPASTSGGGRQTQDGCRATRPCAFAPPGMNTAADIMVSSCDAGRGAQAGFSSGCGQPTANSRPRRRVGAAAVVSGLNARTAAGAVSLGDAAQWRQLQAAGSKLLQQEGAPPRGSRRQRRRSRWRVAAAASQAAAAEQPPKPAPKFDRQVP